MYKLVQGKRQAEIVINKSRFIGTSFSCFSESEAKEKIAEIKKQFSDATHNCYAYIFDELGNQMKYSDDGEPQGTAGLPILEVIKNKNLKFTGVVITRYFGGIKLGAGGLVRAYTEIAAKVLDESEIKTMTESVEFSVAVSYSLTPILEKQFSFLKKLNAEFGDNVIFTFVVKKADFEKVKADIIDKTLGKAKIDILKEDYFAF